ncbi:hypothetical protein ABZ714_09635 [Streptomyces sp. NPDC006798]|uniref:hypothetical protein n=1 Tax=Streptomyces sp. NPDC006798 TaxID=3155462 RepID=UPI0033FB1619
MTREALLGAPEPFTPPCAHCGRETAAPVVVGVVERMVTYGCPGCAARYGAGPSPDDEVEAEAE